MKYLAKTIRQYGHTFLQEQTRGVFETKPMRRLEFRNSINDMFCVNGCESDYLRMNLICKEFLFIESAIFSGFVITLTSTSGGEIIVAFSRLSDLDKSCEPGNLANLVVTRHQ